MRLCTAPVAILCLRPRLSLNNVARAHLWSQLRYRNQKVMSREIALCVFFNLCLNNWMLLRRKKRKPKRYCRRILFLGWISVAENLLEKLKLEEGMGLRNFVRMSHADFEILLYRKIALYLGKPFQPVFRYFLVRCSITSFVLFLFLYSSDVTSQRQAKGFFIIFNVFLHVETDSNKSRNTFWRDSSLLYRDSLATWE